MSGKQVGNQVRLCLRQAEQSVKEKKVLDETAYQIIRDYFFELLTERQLEGCHIKRW